MENQEWQQNTRWSSHDGGFQPGDDYTVEATNELEDDILFSEIVRKAVKLGWGNEKGPENSVYISLDDLDKFLESYVNGIGKIRWYCEKNGVRKSLSKLGYDRVIFTTLPPPGDTFYVNIVYKRRILALPLDAVNLYIMGWRGAHGTYEIDEKSSGQTYMDAKGVTHISVKKTYSCLAPKRNVKNVKLGLYAMQDAFEKMHNTKDTFADSLDGMATFAVNICEPARLQSIFRDICLISKAHSVDTLDSRSKNNSFWVGRYSYYGRLILEQVADLDNGVSPKPIRPCKRAVHLNVQITESIVLGQIRIFLWDMTKRSEPLEPKPTESRGKKGPKGGGNENRRRRGHKGGGDGSDEEKGPKGGGDGGSTALALYLLDDWHPSSQVDSEKKISIKDEEHAVSILSAQWIEEFLHVFPAVKKFVSYETKEPCPASKLQPLAVTPIAQYPDSSLSKESRCATKFFPVLPPRLLLPQLPAPRSMGMLATIGRKITCPRSIMAAKRLLRLLV